MYVKRKIEEAQNKLNANIEIQKEENVHCTIDIVIQDTKKTRHED